jgi:hypothetical protein
MVRVGRFLGARHFSHTGHVRSGGAAAYGTRACCWLCGSQSAYGWNQAAAATEQGAAEANASFVLACYSENYFAASLRHAGSTPLVTTRALMAPEGYLIHAIVEGLGQNLTVPSCANARCGVTRVGSGISEREARRVFSP